MSSATSKRTRKIVIRVIALVLVLLTCGVTEADWARINELLKESWRSLAKAVKV